VPAFITAQPASQSVAAGQPVTFSVGAGGHPAVELSVAEEWHQYPGATASTLSIASAQVSDQGVYAVGVSNPGGVCRTGVNRPCWVRSVQAAQLTIVLAAFDLPCCSQIIVSWPVTADTWQLQTEHKPEHGQLGQRPRRRCSVNGRWQVVVSPATGIRFYRLVQGGQRERAHVVHLALTLDRRVCSSLRPYPFDRLWVGTDNSVRRQAVRTATTVADVPRVHVGERSIGR